MNRYLGVFLIVCLLTAGAILVYGKNNPGSAPTDNKDQILSGFDKIESSGNNAQSMNTSKFPEVKELLIEDVTVGTGSAVKQGDTVEVNYLGTLLDGTKFDSSYDRNQTFSFTVGGGQVIQGWEKGLIDMKTGGKRKLTIPSNMAYGPAGAGGIIPPNAPLIFEIELVSIK